MKMYHLFIFLFLATFLSGCKKIIHKYQLLDNEGKWVVKEQRIKIVHYDGEVSMDTVLYNSGFFEFKKFTRKEIKQFERAGATLNSDVVGYVSYSMWIPTVNTATFSPSVNTQYYLDKSTISADWSSSQVVGFKPNFLIGDIEIKTNQIGNDKQEWVYDYGRRSANTDIIRHILILERP